MEENSDSPRCRYVEGVSERGQSDAWLPCEALEPVCHLPRRVWKQTGSCACAFAGCL